MESKSEEMEFIIKMLQEESMKIKETRKKVTGIKKDKALKEESIEEVEKLVETEIEKLEEMEIVKEVEMEIEKGVEELINITRNHKVVWQSFQNHILTQDNGKNLNNTRVPTVIKVINLNKINK